MVRPSTPKSRTRPSPDTASRVAASITVFDIGFSEMVVIGVVALVVIGPERLPKVARTAGLLFGRMQRYVNDVKADINREMDASELRDLKNSVQDAASSMQQAMNAHTSDIQDEIRKTEEEFNRLSNPMVHFGSTAAAAEGATPVELPAPVETDAVEPSPQLELGLANAGDPVAAAGRETAAPHVG